MSAGSFWRSPSIGIRITEPRARSSAAESAAVWPQFRFRNATRTCSGSRILDLPASRGGGPVDRAVVDEDQFVAHPQRREHGMELAVERFDVAGLVVDGDQDRPGAGDFGLAGAGSLRRGLSGWGLGRYGRSYHGSWAPVVDPSILHELDRR